jgi:hypothetical protein
MLIGSSQAAFENHLPSVVACSDSNQREAAMRQSAKVTAIYRELRQTVGGKATAAEMLACAASLVELFSLDNDATGYDLRAERQPLDMLPVDVALADGGWRNLCREWNRMGWESSDGCGGMRPSEWLVS